MRLRSRIVRLSPVCLFLVLVYAFGFDSLLFAAAAVSLTALLLWLALRGSPAPDEGKIIAAMRKLGEGEFEVEVEVEVDDERSDGLADIAAAFNAMVAKVRPMLMELRDTRDYFEGIVESSADIIVTVSPSAYVFTFNRGAEQTLGYDRFEVIGRHVGMIFADPDEQVMARRRLHGVENVVNHETRLLTKSGEIREVLLTLSRLRDPEGRTIGSFGIAKDMTEANRMRQKLLQSEKLAAVGQALAGIQHALKNMLNAMKGGAYMVRLGLNKDDRALLEEGWGMVEGGIESVTGMSSHMLSFVKEWKPDFKDVDMAAMIREIGELFRPTAEGKGAGFDAYAPEDTPSVRCDSRLVHSAIMDILSNALDACMEKEYPDGETPAISVGVGSSENGEDFVLSIRDNGCGMTPDIVANVFTPFFSTKKSWGTGLGMALTARTIRLHGGEIEVESEPEVGTEFRIKIPMGKPNQHKE